MNTFSKANIAIINAAEIDNASFDAFVALYDAAMIDADADNAAYDTETQTLIAAHDEAEAMNAALSINHASAVLARIAYEATKTDDVMSSQNVDKLNKAAKMFAVADVAALLTASNVDTASFANKDVYMIESAASIMQYASSRAISIAALKTNVFEVLKTAFNFDAANEVFTYDDALTALDATRKTTKAATLYERRTSVFSSAKRHTDMTLNAMLSLSILEATSKKTYKLADNAIVSTLRDRFAA